MNTEWSDAHPAQSALRREVLAMVDAIVSALLRELGEDAIRGIYFKGSAQREWETLLDYVPELSDVDVHVWLADDEAGESCGIDLETAFCVQAGIERAYYEAIPEPIHVPRPQIMPLNRLKRQIEYVPPPPGGVQLLYGEAMEEATMPAVDILRIDADRLIQDRDAVLSLPLKTIDRPARYIWAVLAFLSWRVSPTGPRVLDLLGVPPEQTWKMNRTAVVRSLRERGQNQLADSLCEYYVYAWDFFLSGYEDNDVARKAIRAGTEAIITGAQVATDG